MSAGLSTTQIWPFSRRRGLLQILHTSCSVKVRQSAQWPISDIARVNDCARRIPPLRSR
jgi:hypothetical protein